MPISTTPPGFPNRPETPKTKAEHVVRYGGWARRLADPVSSDPVPPNPVDPVPQNPDPIPPTIDPIPSTAVATTPSTVDTANALVPEASVPGTEPEIQQEIQIDQLADEILGNERLADELETIPIRSATDPSTIASPDTIAATAGNLNPQTNRDPQTEAPVKVRPPEIFVPSSDSFLSSDYVSSSDYVPYSEDPLPGPKRSFRQRLTITDQYDVESHPAGLVLGLPNCPPRIAICFQQVHVCTYNSPYTSARYRSGAEFGHGPILSISAAANFGLRDPNAGQRDPNSERRDPDIGATVALLMINDLSPLRPQLGHVLALILREAACLPQRFRDTGLEIFLFAPDPFGLYSAKLGLSNVNPFTGYPLNYWALKHHASNPHSSNNYSANPHAPHLGSTELGSTEFGSTEFVRPPVTDFAGHTKKVPVTLHSLTPIGLNGLRTLQIETEIAAMTSEELQAYPKRPKPYAGNVEQDMPRLRRSNPAEYRRVAAHQARLALLYSCSL